MGLFHAMKLIPLHLGAPKLPASCPWCGKRVVEPDCTLLEVEDGTLVRHQCGWIVAGPGEAERQAELAALLNGAPRG